VADIEGLVDGLLVQRGGSQAHGTLSVQTGVPCEKEKVPSGPARTRFHVRESWFGRELPRTDLFFGRTPLRAPDAFVTLVR
jgi:hypothetical protein